MGASAGQEPGSGCERCRDLEHARRERASIGVVPVVEEGDELLHMLRALLQRPSEVNGADAAPAVPDGTPKLCYASVEPSWAMSETLETGLLSLAEDMENKKERSVAKFRLLEMKKDRYSTEEAYDDWLDLMGGGDGPWAL